MSQPEATDLRSWSAHERINVKRATTEEGQAMIVPGDGAAGMTASEPNYPPLTTREIQTLPEGARVIVTWAGGNDGPHEYGVHWRRGEPYAQTDDERHEGRVDLEKWLTYYIGSRRPFTRVWALAARRAE